MQHKSKGEKRHNQAKQRTKEGQKKDKRRAWLSYACHEVACFLVNQLCRRLAVWLVERRLAIIGHLEGEVADFGVHAIDSNLYTNININSRQSASRETINEEKVRHKKREEGCRACSNMDISVLFYLGVRKACDLLQVVLRACRNAREEDLLRHAATQHHAHAVEQLQVR